MGGSCSSLLGVELDDVVEPDDVDFEHGCYHCGSLEHYARDCQDAPRPSVVCHQCGGDHLARHCSERGTPERWQTAPVTVEANWGGSSGRYQCEHCTAQWVRTRNRIAP